MEVTTQTQIMATSLQEAVLELVGSDVQVIINGAEYKDIEIVGATKPTLKVVKSKMAEMDLAKARAMKLEEITLKFEKDLGSLVSTHHNLERETWTSQREEAVALKLDAKTQTPLLVEIAKGRGMPVLDLAVKVLHKSNLLATASGRVLGAKQGLEAKVKDAKTVAQILAIRT